MWQAVDEVKPIAPVLPPRKVPGKGRRHPLERQAPDEDEQDGPDATSPDRRRPDPGQGQDDEDDDPDRDGLIDEYA